MTTPLPYLLEKTIDIVKQAGVHLREAWQNPTGRTVTAKERNSFVTDMDVLTEQRLVKQLRELLPEATFITEESTTEQAAGEWSWVIDPIDGTTNFMYRLPCFSISVALAQNGVPMLGVVYEVMQDECFSAIRGGGAFLNGIPIQVNPAESIKDALIATGFPYHDHTHTDALVAIVADLIRGGRGLRRFGSAAVDLAYVACGRFDAFYEHTLNQWDIAAGVLIVMEAGGVVSDFSGQDDYLHNGQMVAAAAPLHQELQSLVAKHFFSR